MKLHSVKLRKDEHHDTIRKLDGTSIEHMEVHYIYCEKMVSSYFDSTVAVIKAFTIPKL